MPKTVFKIAGLGELLWDIFPSGRQLGGAPANFAYIATLLGDHGIVASRVGVDEPGESAIAQLSTLGVDTSFVQRDLNHITGSVAVDVDDRGQPCFGIASDVAWDFLEWSGEWSRLAGEVDAVCFGSLAQRSAQSRATICNFVRSMLPGKLRVFDVNLRQRFFNAEILRDSIAMADIIKVNHEEMPKIVEMLGLASEDICSSACRLAALYNLKIVCVTRGAYGSVLATSDQRLAEHRGYRVKVADTVGSGDAFTAALAHEFLRGSSLEQINETANRVGAWVATQSGAMPKGEPGCLLEAITRIV
jgi:fructokinase